MEVAGRHTAPEHLIALATGWVRPRYDTGVRGINPLSKTIKTISGVTELRNWARNAPEGSIACYHVGQLFDDRVVARRRGDDGEADRLNATANLAWELYQDGRVELVQAKMPDHTDEAARYAYIAIRRSRRT